MPVTQRAFFCGAARWGVYQDRKREQCFINYNYSNVVISKYFKYTKMATSGNMTKKSMCNTPFSPPLWCWKFPPRMIYAKKAKIRLLHFRGRPDLHGSANPMMGLTCGNPALKIESVTVIRCEPLQWLSFLNLCAEVWHGKKTGSLLTISLADTQPPIYLVCLREMGVF